jgi:hypothetical protein
VSVVANKSLAVANKSLRHTACGNVCQTAHMVMHMRTTSRGQHDVASKTLAKNSDVQVRKLTSSATSSTQHMLQSGGSGNADGIMVGLWGITHQQNA